jgi:hypothetical protein
VNYFNEWINWCDTHSGFLSLVLFLITLLIGWLGGFFKYIGQKPKFTPSLIQGPSFVTIVPSDTKFEGRSTHRVVISLYLSIANTGSAAGSIFSISAAYKFPPTSLKEFFKSRWNFIKETVALSDFSRQIGDHVKVYPFIRQKSFFFDSKGSTYFRVGEIHNGITYFENENLAYGSHRPIVKNGLIKIKLKIIDSFGRQHIKVIPVPEVSVEAARLYSKHIGNTHSSSASIPGMSPETAASKSIPSGAL